MQFVAPSLLVCSAALLAGCAQVPRESVTLSQTLGRDLQEVQRAHVSLVDLHYDRLERDVNHFIDNVYVPHQIHATLSDPDIGGVLQEALVKAADASSGAPERRQVYDLLQAYLGEVYADVEDYRKAKLTPLREQRRRVSGSIAEAYTRMMAANAATTGFLSSVVQVRDLQNELLAKAGLPDLQNDIARELDAVSQKLQQLLAARDKTGADYEKMKKEFEALLESLKNK